MAFNSALFHISTSEGRELPYKMEFGLRLRHCSGSPFNCTQTVASSLSQYRHPELKNVAPLVNKRNADHAQENSGQGFGHSREQIQ